MKSDDCAKVCIIFTEFPWQQESTIPKERDQTLETPKEDMCSVWYVEIQLCYWKCSESRLLICETDLNWEIKICDAWTWLWNGRYTAVMCKL